jgi:hypothetical protein
MCTSATSSKAFLASFYFIFVAAVNSTIEANKAGGMHH